LRSWTASRIKKQTSRKFEAFLTETVKRRNKYVDATPPTIYEYFP
jgi:hypothetical protein